MSMMEGVDSIWSQASETKKRGSITNGVSGTPVLVKLSIWWSTRLITGYTCIWGEYLKHSGLMMGVSLRRAIQDGL